MASAVEGVTAHDELHVLGVPVSVAVVRFVRVFEHRPDQIEVLLKIVDNEDRRLPTRGHHVISLMLERLYEWHGCSS